MKKTFKESRAHYHEILIPDELSEVVEMAIKKGTNERKNKNSWSAVIKLAAVTLGAITVLNLSPTIAYALVDIPLVGNIVEVITFREYTIEEDSFHAKVEIPEIIGMEDSKTIKSLNEKYYEEGKALYDEFDKEVEEFKEEGIGGHMGMDITYDIKTNNEDILAIGRSVNNTVNGSFYQLGYDNVDKIRDIIITLSSIFTNEDYIEIISANIKEQMAERVANDDSLVYWYEEDDPCAFATIEAEHNFYITEDHTLVVIFDKYEVSPGYMGVQEFEIPTAIYKDILTNAEYLQ